MCTRRGSSVLLSGWRRIIGWRRRSLSMGLLYGSERRDTGKILKTFISFINLWASFGTLSWNSYIWAVCRKISVCGWSHRRYPVEISVANPDRNLIKLISGTARFKTNRSRSPLVMRKLLLAYFLIPHGSCFPGSHCPLAFTYIFLDLLFYFLGIRSRICWFHVRECFPSILLIILHSNTSFCLIFRFIMNTEHSSYPIEGIQPVFMVPPSLTTLNSANTPFPLIGIMFSLENSNT